MEAIPAPVAFPRPLLGSKDAPDAFSFSGLKTAAARWAEQHRQRGEDIPLADADTATDAHGVRTVTTTTDGTAQEARTLALTVRDGLPCAVAIGTEDGALVLALNKAARATGLNASHMVKQLLGGRGGGSPEVAQGGGLRPEAVTATLAAPPTLLAGG